MAIELHAADARLDYSPSVGISARLEVHGANVLVRVDLPTWEWIILQAPVHQVMRELLRARDRRVETAQEATPLFNDK